VTEEVMLKMANHVHKVTRMENLCLAGGVALNCVGNGRILRESKFKRIWIQPAAGDAGGALGAALSIWHQYLNSPRAVDGQHDQQKGSYLGPSEEKEIEEFVQTRGVICEKLDDSQLPRRIAQALADQKIVGLFHGRMEFGPRALGARSIIADARSLEMQSVLNLKTKFRESFRPFAPSVLEEKAREYFCLEGTSPYMLLVAKIKDDKIHKESLNEKKAGIEKLRVKRSVIPAVTHIDYSARIQTVSKKNNPFFYQVIKEFFDLTGCPVIINTSFNVRGEPIVCTPQDAYRSFMCTNIDYLAMGPYLFDKMKQPSGDEYKLEQISRILD
ncbi:MAG TPA: carbamoyltransferase C-terminal domain-containing protein, partial [Candidatus Omnitrophota bacterium]|nr:carbamoyltransferase C-terminal domain-containing protein [Candidatus Omnitrophota bacterium]